ncbi:hypothetical protein XH98_00535 [Bradyrhizobium sp. CCBAU 51745]|nr:hypothetical protein [Bradyrhizobium sp. CCBAU 51745]
MIQIFFPVPSIACDDRLNSSSHFFTRPSKRRVGVKIAVNETDAHCIHQVAYLLGAKIWILNFLDPIKNITDRFVVTEIMPAWVRRHAHLSGQPIVCRQINQVARSLHAKHLLIQSSKCRVTFEFLRYDMMFPQNCHGVPKWAQTSRVLNVVGCLTDFARRRESAARNSALMDRAPRVLGVRASIRAN